MTQKHLTVESLKTILVGVLERISGLPEGRVLVEPVEGPRPSSGLYATLWWKEFELLPESGGDYGRDETGCDFDKEEPLSQTLRHEAWNSVQVSFYGPDGFETAVKTAKALQADPRWFDLWAVLGYGGTGPVRIAASSDDDMGHAEAKAFFELSFYACFGETLPVEWFDVSQWELSAAGETEEFEHSKEIHDDQPCCLP